MNTQQIRQWTTTHPVTFAGVKAWLAKPIATFGFFLAGVLYDSLTLTRIDRLFDNLILLLYISLLATLIILIGRAQLGALPPAAAENGMSIAGLLIKAQPYYVRVLQFLFGGLFSAYAIVYAHSASLDASVIFLGMIVVLLIANEFLHDRFSSLTLLLILFAIVIFSFMTFFLPVLTGWMNTWMFLIGAGLSMVVMWRIVDLTYQGIPVQRTWTPLATSFPAYAMIALLVGFYFLNWIPPVPLSLKFGGIYHNVTQHQNIYELTYEKGAWYEFWKRSDDPFHGEGPIYCFVAVFAPVNLEITIYHHWQHRPFTQDDTTKPSFTTTDRIPIKISGGRDEGYRTYTMKRRAAPGEWQVTAETEGGKQIGRVNFTVEDEPPEPVELESIRY